MGLAYSPRTPDVHETTRLPNVGPADSRGEEPIGLCRLTDAAAISVTYGSLNDGKAAVPRSDDFIRQV